MAKIRLGFVSNSSSSSFVIAYKEMGSIDDETLKKYTFLKWQNKFIQELLKGDRFISKEQFDKYFIDYYGCRGDSVESILNDEGEWLKTFYNDCVDKLERGYSLVEITVDYGDSMEDFINTMADKENFIVLKGG